MSTLISLQLNLQSRRNGFFLRTHEEEQTTVDPTQNKTEQNKRKTKK